MYKFEWKHFILDFREAQRNIWVLYSEEKLRDLVMQIAKEIDATLLSIHSHSFWDWTGVSVIGIVEESHISIHTYPEYKGAMIDIFTCWDKANPFKAREFLLNYFRPVIIEKLLSLRRWDAE